MKTRLNDILTDESGEVTILTIPSLSLGKEILENILGIAHYESRMIWEILKARCPRTRVVCVTSIHLEEAAINHLIEMLPNPHEAKKRIKFISIGDSNWREPLSKKILKNKKILERIKKETEGRKVYMDPFLVSNLEKKLAEKLDIPLFGLDTDLSYYQTKSGNRQIFEEAQIPFPAGESDIKNKKELVKAILNHWKVNPELSRLVIKLNLGVSGDGNALLCFPFSYRHFCELYPKSQEKVVLSYLENDLKFQSKTMNWQKFAKALKDGAIIEDWIEGEEKASPSGQGLVFPDGTVEVLSTHEQILDDNGQTFLGCEFPAKDGCRQILQEYTKQIGKALSEKGIVGAFSADFLSTGEKLYAIEINIRQGGTTHPHQAARLLTNAKLDLKTGLLTAPNQKTVFYRSSDNYLDPLLQNTNLDEFLYFMKSNGIVFDSDSQKGVVFHLLSAMKEYGKLGYTCIAETSQEAKSIELRLKDLLKTFPSATKTKQVMSS